MQYGCLCQRHRIVTVIDEIKTNVRELTFKEYLRSDASSVDAVNDENIWIGFEFSN